MSKKRYVSTTFWRDEYVSNLDPIEKLLFLYLLTNPDTNISGVYQLPIKIMATDTGIDKDMLTKIIGRFQDDDKVMYQDGWVVVKNFIKHQNYNSISVKTGIERELDTLPTKIRDYVGILPNSLLDISQGLSKVKLAAFTIPTIEQITEYCKERNNSVDPNKFFDFYESKGWMVGKNKMKDYRAAIRTWETNNKKQTESIYKTYD